MCYLAVTQTPLAWLVGKAVGFRAGVSGGIGNPIARGPPKRDLPLTAEPGQVERDQFAIQMQNFAQQHNPAVARRIGRAWGYSPRFWKRGSGKNDDAKQSN